MTINLIFAECFTFLIISYSLIYGLHVSYNIAFTTECLDDKYIFHKLVQISLDQCVVECVRRPACLAISFCRRFTLCNLLNTDGSEIAYSSKDNDCVFVPKSGMRYNLPPSCQECKTGQNCDIENEKCTITECPKLSLDNGLVLGNMNGIGNRVKFTCNSGYRVKTGEIYATCKETGKWSITPKCVKECPKLSLDNGLLDGDVNGIAGDRVYFECNSGYKRETGDIYTTCGESGKWSINPKCVEVKCPTDWQSFRKSCYKMGTDRVNFDDAKAECERDEAHLVYIDDEYENNFIKDLVQWTRVWIGLRKTGKNWTWTDNTVPSFVDWLKIESQPSLTNFRKCVMVDKDGWRTVECISTIRLFRPVCEKQK